MSQAVASAAVTQTKEPAATVGDLFRALFHDSPRPLIIYNAHTLRILAANGAAVALYGYEQAEFRELEIPQLWSEGTSGQAERAKEDAAAFVRSLPLQQPTQFFRRLHARKNRQPLDVEISSTPIAYEGVSARVLHVLDLTKKMEVQRLAAQASRAQRMLSACNEALIRAINEEELLKRVCEVAVEVGGYVLAWIGFAQHDEDKTVLPAAVAGVNGHLVLEAELSWAAQGDSGKNSAGRAIRAGKPDVTFDVREDASFPIWQASVDAIGYRGIVSLPLRHRGTVLGAMCFYSAAVAHVGPSELSLLESLADDVAFGIENLRVQDEQRRLHQAVLSVGSAVSHRTGDDFFEHLVQGLVEATGAQAGQLARFLPGSLRRCQSRCATSGNGQLHLPDFDVAPALASQMQTTEVLFAGELGVMSYPDARLAQQVGAEAFAMHRLDDVQGDPIGFIAVLYRAAQPQSKFVEAMLRIFAARASAELQRLQSDSRIRSQASLLDKAQDAIYVRDLDHRILTWNQGCERIFGWAAEEMIGRDATEFGSGSLAEKLARHSVLLKDGAWSG